MPDEVLNEMKKENCREFAEALLDRFFISDEISGAEYDIFKETVDAVLWEFTK